ncbi:group II intron reverse transcriptase/maturase [uncultured Desulfobacter sp.]|uniref:group II intron reverse transcriptase/maturase n=1 Tax=uncultured Desulfobacter sp. TaxID=240139 RepID=UPI002AA77B87|nr:group II intron reverse transcriptase/maturase [uncultured Desulfobacter sp.]
MGEAKSFDISKLAVWDAYIRVKRNDGGAGVDAVSLEMFEEDLENNLYKIWNRMSSGSYFPPPARTVLIPKSGGTRTLGIPTVADRIAQMTVKLYLEPELEPVFDEDSYGYRPGKSALDALNATRSRCWQFDWVLDLDIKGFFDNVRHHILLDKVAERVNDAQIMRLLKLILKVGGKKGVPQGGVISPLLSNIYLNEVDKMLERAKEVTRNGRYTYIEYSRFADDLVILVDGFSKWNWLVDAANKRLLEELEKLDVQLNREKSKLVDLTRGETFSFLGFDFRRAKTRRGKLGVLVTPRMKARTALLSRLKEVFRRFRSQPLDRIVAEINPILRGWVNYFRIGNSSQCFGYVKDWVERKIRRHLMRARKRSGFGWNRWSRAWLYKTFGLFNNYKVIRYQA